MLAGALFNRATGVVFLVAAFSDMVDGRLAQLVIVPVVQAKLMPVDSFETSQRGAGVAQVLNPHRAVEHQLHLTGFRKSGSLPPERRTG